MRTFYDSTNVGNLPPHARGALRYVDGLYAESEASVRQRCPRIKTIIGVTVRGGDADMADVEPGDLNPRSAAHWAKLQLAKTGRPHILYFPLSWHGQVAAECKALGLRPGRDVLFFAARYGRDETIPAGFVGVQYLSPDGPADAQPGGHYDVSAVVDYIPGIDPKPRLAALRHGPRRNARRLNRELRRVGRLTAPRDRRLLARLDARIGRVLGVRGGK